MALRHNSGVAKSVPALYMSLMLLPGDSSLRTLWKRYVDYFNIGRDPATTIAKQMEVHEDSATLSQLDVHPRCWSSVESVAFSTDGKRILATADGIAYILIAESGLQEFEIASSRVEGAAFSPDEQTVATLHRDAIRTWNALTGELLNTFSDDESGSVCNFTCFTYSHDGRVILVGTIGGSLLWKDTSSGSVTQRQSAHSTTIDYIAFSPDGTRVVTAAWNSVLLWDADTRQSAGQIPSAFGMGHYRMGFTFSPNSCQLAITIQKWETSQIQIWDVRQQPFQKRLELANDGPMAFSPDGKHIYGVNSEVIRCYDAQSGSKIGITLCGHSEAISCISVSTNGSRMATGSYDGSIRIWDTRDFHTSEGIDFSKVQCGTRGPNKIPVDIPDDHWIRTADGIPLLRVPFRYRGRFGDMSLLQIFKEDADGQLYVDWERLFRISGKNWPGGPIPQ